MQSLLMKALGSSPREEEIRVSDVCNSCKGKSFNDADRELEYKGFGYITRETYLEWLRNVETRPTAREVLGIVLLYISGNSVVSAIDITEIFFTKENNELEKYIPEDGSRAIYLANLNSANIVSGSWT